MAVVLDVNAVTIEGSIVELRGCDIDQLMIKDFDEATDLEETIVRFDLDKQGNRVYLYKVVKSTMKAGQSMQDAIKNLAGQVLRLSSNFVVKED